MSIAFENKLLTNTADSTKPEVAVRRVSAAQRTAG